MEEEVEKLSKKQKVDNADNDITEDEWIEEEFFVVLELPDYESNDLLFSSKSFSMLVSFCGSFI